MEILPVDMDHLLQHMVLPAFETVEVARAHLPGEESGYRLEFDDGTYEHVEADSAAQAAEQCERDDVVRIVRMPAPCDAIVHSDALAPAEKLEIVHEAREVEKGFVATIAQRTPGTFEMLDFHEFARLHQEE